MEVALWYVSSTPCNTYQCNTYHLSFPDWFKTEKIRAHPPPPEVIVNSPLQWQFMNVLEFLLNVHSTRLNANRHCIVWVKLVYDGSVERQVSVCIMTLAVWCIISSPCASQVASRCVTGHSIIIHHFEPSLKLIHLTDFFESFKEADAFLVIYSIYLCLSRSAYLLYCVSIRCSSWKEVDLSVILVL